MLVPYDLSDPGGGVKHHAHELAQELRSAGDQVTTIGPSSQPLDRPHTRSFGGVVSFRANGSDNRMGVMVCPWQVYRFFRSHRFDVLHVHEPLTPTLPYWAAWFSPGVAKVVTFHAYTEQPPLRLRISQHVFSKLQFPLVDRGIAVSEPAARHAGAGWDRPLTIIPNGVRADEFRPPESPCEHSGPLRLLFVGHLADERKGVRFLLQAYQRLRDRGVDVELDIVGPRDRFAPLPDLAGIRSHGAVSRAELIQAYRRCDVFVAASTGGESFGIILLEAMACARPIVCSDIEGYRLIAHADGAILVPPADPEALALALHQLAADPDRRKRMGEVNRQAVQQYDWRALAPRIRAEYLLAMQTPRARAASAGEEPAP